MRPHPLGSATAAVLLLTLGSFALARDKTKPAEKADSKADAYSAFPLVRTRNIFDPKRKAPRPETPVAAKPAAPARPRSNAMSLTGTMVTATKSLAFFSGENGAGSKVLAVGDSLANFKILAISATEVELDHAGKTTALAVGKQIAMDGAISAPPPAASESQASEAPATADNGSSTATPSATTTPPPPAATDQNDVLRRMRERREKENSK